MWRARTAVFYAVVLAAVAAVVMVVAVSAGTRPAEAAFPGSNGKIAFSSNRVTADNPDPDGTGPQRPDFEIFVMNPDGTGLTQLTTNTARDSDPTWSPDGSKIAFTSARDGNDETYTMNADGSSQTNITDDPALDRDPDWQPIPPP